MPVLTKILILSLLCFSVEAKNFCPVTPPNKELVKNNFALAIKSWLRVGGGRKINSVKDFICCMPESLRKNVTVNFASISAQQSNYHSPRIILFDQDNFLSFSMGKDKSLSQHSNIEIMQNNKRRQKGTLEFFDVDISKGKPILSKKNPSKCMSCHGGNDENRHAGPHPNFGADRVWERFYGGTSTSCRDGMTKALHAANKASQKAFKDEKFDCLLEDELGVFEQPIGPLQALDNILKTHNANRIARIVKNTPDYDKYKYLVMGTAYCSWTPLMQSQYKMNLNEWMPKDVINKHNNLSFISKDVRNSNSIEDVVHTRLAKEFEKANRIDKYLGKIAKDITNGKNPEFRFYAGPARCQDQKKFPSELSQLIKSEKQGIPNLDLYNLDSHLRATGRFGGFLDYKESHQKVNPILRFVFEGRGIDIGDWTMSENASTYKRDPATRGALFKALIKYESDRSPLKKYAKYAKQSPPNYEICDDLKKRSYEALSKLKLELKPIEEESLTEQ